MAVHVEVPGDFRQGELNAVELSRENDLTSQSRVLLKHGRHVQHVVLPENRDIVGSTFRRDLTFDVGGTLTARRVRAVCRNEERSRRRGTWSRPVTPRRLLKTTTKTCAGNAKRFQPRASSFTASTHLPSQFHVCEPETERYLLLCPSLGSSGQIDL